MTDDKRNDVVERVTSSEYWGQKKGTELHAAGGTSRFKRNIIIFACIIALVLALGYSCNMVTRGIFDGTSTYSPEEIILPDYNYIAIIHVNGVIGDSGDYLWEDAGYHHQWTLDRIDELIDDPYNVGLILSINSPGGSVFTSDELYLKIKDYKEQTNCPVYASMQEIAASGGYYVAAPADKIYANRNAITGSIGITMGNHFDISGLMDKYGVKAEPLTSGENKAMGDVTRPLTPTQRQIYAGIISDAYEQFLDVVTEGRGMERDHVRRLADGRIYTARQAVDNGLVDGLATLEEVGEKMIKEEKLKDAEIVSIDYISNSFWRDFFKGMSASMPQYSGDVEAIMSIVNKNNMPVSYLCMELV